MLQLPKPLQTILKGYGLKQILPKSSKLAKNYFSQSVVLRISSKKLVPSLKDTTLNKAFLLILAYFTIFLTSCLQDEDTESRLPVRYTVIVTDKISGKAVNKAKVELTNEVQSAQTLSTNSSGTVIFPSEESYVNQIIVTKDGYFPKDTVDVISNPDTSLNLILRSISIFLVPTDTAKVDSTK